MNKGSIVVPLFNESGRVVNTIREILRRSKHLVIAVDDGSADDSLVLLRKSFANNRRVVIFGHVINLGKGAAMKTGAEAAWKMGCDWVIFIDADGQHDPKHLPVFEAELKEEVWFSVIER